MDEIEILIWWLLFFIFWLPILDSFLYDWANNNTENNNIKKKLNEDSKNVKIYNKIDSLNLKKKKIEIKRDKITNEIKKLDFEGMNDFEKEEDNSLKIRELEYELLVIDKKIEKLDTQIENLHNDLQ